ncbi:MAG: PhnA domain-containing protein [Chitinophagales bacterium]
MTYLQKLKTRANDCCEICNASNASKVITVPPKEDDSIDHQVLVCDTCESGYKDNNFSDTNHWRALIGSIWSEVPAVQALSYNILDKMKSNDWAVETLESIYLDEEIITWGLFESNQLANKIIHKDAYGSILETGDNVVLIENLNVKGTSYIAPKGTQVKKIRLVHDNADQIEGKINGDTIVILTKFLKKAS